MLILKDKFVFSLFFLLHLIPLVHSAKIRPFTSTSLPLREIFDNQAASSDGSANFDGHGGSFNSQFLPHGPFVHDGIKYDTPKSWGNGSDNVIANGQLVSIDPEYVHELHFLYAGDASGGEFVKNFILNFENNSTLTVQLYAKNWWRWPNLNKGEIQTPYHFESQGSNNITKNFNSSQIHQWSTAVPSESKLKSITFPLNNPAHRLHLFGISYSSSAPPGAALEPLPSISTATEKSNQARDAPESQAVLAVRRARFTTKWELLDHNQRAQVVEVTLANLLPTFTLSKSTSLNSKHTISIKGGGIKTLREGTVYRLVPGDQARVDVLITGTEKLKKGSKAVVEVRDSKGRVIGSSGGWDISPLIEEWTADPAKLSLHEAPTWWKKAKYGIFIHWGVYSFPAWAPGGTYAEWYDWDLHNPPNSNSPTWNHHLENYGPDVVYDDFIANFTASKFNASDWLELFDKAGAKYFVFVTKHHDGFAMFDTGNTTHRSSVHLGPKRDFLQELMETAKREKPHIHRGTYYSLPEWFNPDSAKYGFDSWPGGLAHNAFNNTEIEPYTGRLEISDYINDLQMPHMLDLATKYDTEIMWCDIGGPNRTLELAARFYNHAQAQGRQVTINNRCGAVPDFDTPEYATFGAIQTRDWESNEGMDPFSYGLNSATNASQYKNATSIIQTLVDIVSKNGNYLLDVGPNAEGEIIAPMAENLLDAGKWLSYGGDCVFDTAFWFQSSQDQLEGGTTQNPARFATTPMTFCAIAFDEPVGGQVVIRKRLPLLPGDKVFLMHPNATAKGTELKWDVGSSGETTIQVAEEQVRDVQNAWAFQIQYSVA